MLRPRGFRDLEREDMELAAGDRVVYPNQGVCRVTGIEEKEVAGQKLLFVTMQREEDGARVMVPKPKLETIGVRKIASPEEVQKIFAFLKADTEKADLDWKQRARVNLDRMSGGGLLGLAEVVKGLQVLSELRPLPTKERELYDDARHLLVSEMSAALSMPECNAEDAVDIALFPPGKDRPKRTAEEFKRPEDEDLDLGDDLLGVGGDLQLPAEEEPQEAEEPVEAASEEVEEEEPAPQRGRRGGKAGKQASAQVQGGACGRAQDAKPSGKERGEKARARGQIRGGERGEEEEKVEGGGDPGDSRGDARRVRSEGAGALLPAALPGLWRRLRAHRGCAGPLRHGRAAGRGGAAQFAPARSRLRGR
jgi:RNA polymerase-interacting CarD/CdnL/TRCF family regulator